MIFEEKFRNVRKYRGFFFFLIIYAALLVGRSHLGQQFIGAPLNYLLKWKRKKRKRSCKW